MKNIFILIFCIFCSFSTGFRTLYAEGILINGFISQGYMKSSDNNFLADSEGGTFQMNEMGINFSTAISGKLRLGIQFFARDLGTEGNDEIALDWAYADYSFSENFGLRAGKMKMAFNLFNEIRDADFTRVFALLPQSVYPDLYRDVLTSTKGIGVYGNLSIPFIGSVSYDLQCGVLDTHKDSGMAAAFKDNVHKATGWNFTVDDLTHDYATNGRLVWQLPLKRVSLVDFFNIGVGFFDLSGVEITGQAEDFNTSYLYGNNKLRSRFYSVEYAYKKLHMTYEYTHMDIEGVFSIGAFFEYKRPAPSDGWYLTIAYRFSDFAEMGIGYQEYFPHADDKGGKQLKAEGRLPFINWLYDSSATLKLDMNENWIIKLEYHYMDGFGVFSSAKNDPLELDRYWHLFIAKFTYSF